ncbi:amidohydrolase family protein [Dactylosporangium fulvum]|uniref:Amidohydrolase family protein n=1 Tax=Dactylosporangium fulvum TaxID=53359 RepID=A0ABY5VTX1_9ACTN|nr:amidohydrolase family protein [Dactylosporangium fulvum]UWP80281.1 amidohydrolase family protein [Dactylosporangium fulvum]
MEVTKVIRGVTAITMTDQGVVDRATVVLRGNRLGGVHPDGQLPAELTSWADAHPEQVLDLPGRYVIPGLINLHEHLDMHNVRGSMHDRVSGPTVTLVPRAIRNALLALASGVTTLRDLGSKDATNIVIRDIIDMGQFIGPRVVACGQMISATGGHGQPLCAEGDGADAMRHLARLQHKRGADVIKVCASGGVVAMRRENPWAQQLSDEELRAVVEEAHRFGLRVASHAQPPAAIKASVLAGVDTIEHAAFLDDECADLLAERDVALVPTIDDSYSVAYEGERHGRPQWMQDNAKKSIELRMASLVRAVKAGVRLGVGTDVVGKMGREMVHMVEAGRTPEQALAAATRDAAQIIDVPDIGILADGMLADLVVLGRDPLADLSACDDSIELVVRDGVTIRPSALIATCAGGDIV